MTCEYASLDSSGGARRWFRFLPFVPVVWLRPSPIAAAASGSTGRRPVVLFLSRALGRAGCWRRGQVIDAYAQVMDAWLRTDLTLKGSVIHERLVAGYGFTGHYQRVKLYLQAARPKIADELGYTPRSWPGCTAGSRPCPESRSRSTG